MSDLPPSLTDPAPEALLPPGEHVAVDGVRLWVERAGSGPPLLLVPGLGAGTWLWAENRAALAERFALVMPELRGGGRSDKPDERYSIPGFAADLVGVLDAFGIERAHVLGTSLGGFVAQYLAAHYPERVDRLVLAATALGGQNQIGLSGDILSRMIRPRGRTRRERLEDGYVLNFTDAYRTAYPERLAAITDWRTTHPQPEFAYYRQFLGANAYDGAPHSVRITAPTLICTGTDDELVPPENAVAIQRLVPHARIATFPGRHLFFYEGAAVFNAAVLDFLTEDPPPASPQAPDSPTG